MSSEERSPRRIVIIGAGPGAIISGHRLTEAGFTDFVMLEKQSRVGGTWARNRYPGLACDVVSRAYQFSFALKPDWSAPYATQPEILEYMEQCVDELGLRPHVRLETAVRGAHWDDATASWTVVTEAGEELAADVLIASPGMFGEAVWPDIEGRESFAGTAVHTAAWPDGLDLTGKRVAVIGSAASAVQLVPEVAKVASRLHLFQRSANWVLPKDDAPFSPEQIAVLAAVRGVLEVARAEAMETVGAGFAFVQEEIRKNLEVLGIRNISVVTDPELREKLTPTSPWGCQRPLFSNVYYPTFNLPHVELVTDPIARITPTGVVTADGVEREVDVIVYATGYETTRYISALDITGRDGLEIDEAWADGAHAYLGITTAGFPNLFMLYGPNTNHGSIIGMIEYQVDYVVRMLDRMDREGLAWVDVRPETVKAYDERIQRDLDEVTVWDAGCHQYYRVPSGRIVTQWPHSMFTYRDWTTAPDPADAYETATLGTPPAE
jgi:cation diffusion facilitator CzcD-associated flavoprotein CzcO